MRRHLLLSLPALVVLAGACASTNASPSTGAPTDRVLITDAQGQVIRQSALNDRATITLDAPLARVWPAIVGAFADVGIEANYADQANGRYGVRNFNFPRNVNGERIGNIFGCGSSLTGAVVDNGTVRSDVVAAAAAAADNHTTVVIYVSGWVRRNDGNSSDPIGCTSTGRLEELLRASIEKRLAAK